MPENLLQTDVLVVGGGAAGIGAAIGAARSGSRVILLEKSAQFGGKATSAVVGTICGAHYRSSHSQSRYVTEGFAREFCERVMHYSGTRPIHHYQGDLHFLPYSPFSFALAADEVLDAEPLIRRFNHALLTSVKIHQRTILSVSCINHKDELIIEPKKVIDCTGESTVSLLAQIKTAKEEQYQASAMVFSLQNIAPTNPIQLSLNIIRALKKEILEGNLPASFDKVSIVPGSLQKNGVLLKIALPIAINDTADNKTEVEQTGRWAVNQIVACLTKRVSFLKNAYIGMVAPEVGTRTGQLSQGLYTLTQQDVLSNARFDDGIAKGAWPIEIWPPGKNAELQFFEEDTHYEIPARCLVSQHLENLYFAGRIISAEKEAIASARVIGTCLSTGFAAGTLAAFSAQQKSYLSAIKNIREKQVYC